MEKKLMPVVKIGPDNKVSIPKDVLDRLGAKPGDLVQAKFERVVDVPYTDEPIGPETQAGIEEGLKDVEEGRVSGPFRGAQEIQAHLDSLKKSS